MCWIKCYFKGCWIVCVEAILLNSTNFAVNHVIITTRTHRSTHLMHTHISSYLRLLYPDHPHSCFLGNGEKLSQPLPHPPSWLQLSVPCDLHTRWPVGWDAKAVWRRPPSNSLLFSGGHLQVQLWQEAVQRAAVSHCQYECGRLHHSCPLMANQETEHTQKNSHSSVVAFTAGDCLVLDVLFWFCHYWIVKEYQSVWQFIPKCLWLTMDHDQ